MSKKKKHILISLLGRTPQILTEALYVLMITKNIPISEICVFTTTEGEQSLLENLLHPQHGKFYEFCDEFGINKNQINFSEKSIIVASDICAQSVASPANQNQDPLINRILDKLRELTTDPATVLHCSIAGGRKTMSVYFSFAIQFFGRHQDKLYHVLVRPEKFQNHPDFYYIPKTPRLYNFPDKTITTSQAKIDLIEIPFIRLGEKREYIFGDKWPLSYDQMITLTQKKLEHIPDIPTLIVDLPRKLIHIGLKKIYLSPIELATYYYYAERSKARQDAVSSKDYEQYFEAADGYYFQINGLKRLIDIYKNLVSAGTYDNFIRSLDNGNLPFERACQHFSRIKRKIRNALHNDDLAEYYFISAVGKYRKCYGIKLDKSKIILR